MIIDFHTHAFPDSLAERAMRALLSECEVKAYLDGKLSSLIGSMDQAGIEKSVLCSIATQPKQFQPILKWSKEITCDRIIPIPSVHPKDPQQIEHIEEIKKEGFKGIKMHPYYQDFTLDDPALDPLYEAVTNNQLFLVMHTGFDIAFEHIDIAGPQRILNVLDRFPDLKLITTHTGSWFMWEEVEKLILGRPIYMEISMSYNYLGPERMKQIIEKHPQEYVLFGTDSPWDDQIKMVKKIQELELPSEHLEAVMTANAQRLLGMA